MNDTLSWVKDQAKDAAYRLFGSFSGEPKMLVISADTPVYLVRPRPAPLSRACAESRVEPRPPLTRLPTLAWQLGEALGEGDRVHRVDVWMLTRRRVAPVL